MRKDLILIALFSPLLFSCLSTPDKGGWEGISARGSRSVPDESVHEGSDMPSHLSQKDFEEVGIGFNGPADQEYLVFHSYRELDPYIPREDLFREIDFEKEILLAAFMGEQPTGGYMNRISSLEEGSETLTVYIEIIEPAPGDFVAQMITSPWHVVVTARSEKSPRWTEIKPNP
ncbi:MAG: protease complex subunit PrcB family protein [Spirochaetales bacterium]|nr:protease complex subunit PrcB family protein [Spirochaetales bacterium]